MKVISNTEKDWFFAFDERNFLLRLFTTNINYINCFGNIEGNKNVCINNNSTVEYFDTEEELQTRVIQTKQQMLSSKPSKVSPCSSLALL